MTAAFWLAAAPLAAATPTDSPSPSPSASVTASPTPICVHSSGDNADIALGQLNMNANSVNQGGVPGAGTLAGPYDILRVGSRLIVADTNNNRVLIYNSVPTSFGQAADVVIGQADMSSNASNFGGLSAQSLAGPQGLASDGTRLFIADTFNNRILVFNSIPSSNQAAADLVLGQPGFSTNTGNIGGRSASTLLGPRGLAMVNGQLAVAEITNNRVTFFSGAPSVNFEAATLVLGQADFGSGAAGLGAGGLSGPQGVASDGVRLAIADTYNYRVLVYNAVPAANGALADHVLGQPDFNTALINNGGPGPQSLYMPARVAFGNGLLWVADWANHRLTGFNAAGIVDFAAAGVVLGQPDFSSIASSSGAARLAGPQGMAVTDKEIFVAEYWNNRAVVYDCSFAGSATPTFSVSPTRTSTPTISMTPTITLTATVITLEEAVDNLGLSFSTGGFEPWQGQASTFLVGGDAARTGNAASGNPSWMEMSVTGPGALSYDYKIEMTGNNFLRVYRNLTPAIGGHGGVTSPWIAVDLVVPAGPQTYRWAVEYGSSGSRVAYVDDVQFVFGTVTFTPTFSHSPTGTLSHTISPTWSVSPTFSPSPTSSPTPSSTPTPTSTVTRTSTRTRTQTFTATPTPSISPTFSVSPTITLSPTPSLDLYDGIDIWSLPISTSGASWTFQTAVSYDSVDAVEMAPLGNGQTGTFSVAVSGPGTLSYFYRLDGNLQAFLNYDCFNSLLDGVDQEPGCYGDVTNWANRTAFIPAGAHTYTLSFTRQSGSNPTRAWIDGMTFGPAPTFTSTFTRSPTFTPTPSPELRPDALYSFPNPARPGTLTTFVFPPCGEAELEIFDVNLKRLAGQGATRTDPGKGLGWWTPGYDAWRTQGIYFARVKSDKGAWTCKFSLSY